MEFITLWAFSQSWALTNLPNLYWVNVEVVAKHSVSSLFFSYLCGGECLEDINALIGQFKQRPDTLLPGADTVGRGLKELAEKSIVYKSETSDKSYSFNTAQKLNTLLLRMIGRMGLIKVGNHVDLDFDHQYIPAHKFDAKYSYKQDFG